MRTSIGARANLELIEENYRRWQRNPESVDSGWSAFFEGFELGNLPQRDGAAAAEAREAALQTRVDGLVYAYCSLGHTIARVDPLAETRPQNPLLSLHELGFSEADLDLRVSSKFFLDNRPMTLREMVSGLERIYADSIGSEFMHIQDPRVREWIRKRLETRPHKHSTPAAVQLALLRALLEVGIIRDFPAYALRGTEKVLTSGFGVAYGDSRHHSAQMYGRRRRRNLHGHGASRPAQCSGKFLAQIAQGYLY